MTSLCKKCGAEILFVTTATSKVMPVDAEPLLGGNVAVDEYDNAVVLKKHEIVSEMDRGAKHHVSHFATCPAADYFRKERGE